MNKRKENQLIKFLDGYQKKSLTWNKETGDLDEIMVSPRYFKSQEDGHYIIAAEGDEHYHLFADYYNEFGGGYPFIDEGLSNGLNAIGFEIEWQDPGTVSIHEM